ncbi:DUF6665 family protein [Rhizobium sp. FKL33]|uniref:DUF6665 family protein n=1 Tax=Rhizobium sp. FKL33 TaxID=2562307 RepID=UPI0010C0C47D|nr:DUF6665 family protein [Rhizobium sp. FKL33]
MSVRPPQSFTPSRQGESALGMLEYELMSERADSLGRAGLKVEALIGRLRNASEAERDALVYDAADAVQALFIQREVCGLRNGRDIVARYGIPGEVIARLGVRRPTSQDFNR